MLLPEERYTSVFRLLPWFLSRNLIVKGRMKFQFGRFFPRPFHGAIQTLLLYLVKAFCPDLFE